EETVRHLLISGSGASSGGTSSGSSTLPRSSGAMEAGPSAAAPPPAGDLTHQAAAPHAAGSQEPPQIPLGFAADGRIVEGLAMMKSENGQLMNYVTLNVVGRDIVGFVDEAQRVVAQKVKLQEGVHIEWSGEFEHQVRAAQTLRFVFPAVIVLIFIIL